MPRFLEPRSFRRNEVAGKWDARFHLNANLGIAQDNNMLRYVTRYSL